MKFEDIIKVIKDLAKSQGFYGRLLEVIENLEEGELEFLKENLEEKNFKTALDVIYYFED